MDPELYHLHHLNYLEDLPYWLALADQARDLDPAGPILELGCGTGRVMQFLRAEGVRVCGLDFDRQMLAYLKEKDPSATVFLADMTNFSLGHHFPLILLPCNTYSTLSAPQRKATLECVNAHLLPGGCFAASLPNPADLIRMGDSEESGVEETFIHPGTQAPVQVSSSWKTIGGTVTIYWHYDLLQEDGTVQRTTHEISHRLDPAEIYLEEVRQAGFDFIAHGEFNQTPYHPEADFLIIEARKK
ncbi:MAG: class I SAM-dependent methyltransferase [Anaerolineales bacterium]|nr:class I SAM-dependent methyltransferase [Anaerolineales bacterium]